MGWAQASQAVLAEAERIVPNDRLLVLTALETVHAVELTAQGMTGLARLIGIGEVVSTASAILRARAR